jgi:streptogramin lyase
MEKLERLLAFKTETATTADIIGLMGEIGIIVVQQGGCWSASYRDDRLGRIGVEPSEGCEDKPSVPPEEALRSAIRDLQMAAAERMVLSIA